MYNLKPLWKWQLESFTTQALLSRGEYFKARAINAQKNEDNTQVRHC